MIAHYLSCEKCCTPLVILLCRFMWLKNENSITYIKNINNIIQNDNYYFFADDEDGNIIDNEIYNISYNYSTNGANWICYKLNNYWLTYNTTGLPKNRHYGNYSDIGLSKDMQDECYRKLKNKYNRGHLVPLGDRKCRSSKEIFRYINKTNDYINILPQNNTLNAVAWEHLETFIREIAKNTNLVICTGPLYLKNQHTNCSWIPDYFWKIAVNKNKVLISVIIKNVAINDTWKNYNILSYKLSQFINCDFTNAKNIYRQISLKCSYDTDGNINDDYFANIIFAAFSLCIILICGLLSCMIKNCKRVLTRNKQYEIFDNGANITDIP